MIEGEGLTRAQREALKPAGAVRPLRQEVLDWVAGLSDPVWRLAPVGKSTVIEGIRWTVIDVEWTSGADAVHVKVRADPVATVINVEVLK